MRFSHIQAQNSGVSCDFKRRPKVEGQPSVSGENMSMKFGSKKITNSKWSHETGHTTLCQKTLPDKVYKVLCVLI